MSDAAIAGNPHIAGFDLTDLWGAELLEMEEPYMRRVERRRAAFMAAQSVIMQLMVDPIYAANNDNLQSLEDMLVVISPYGAPTYCEEDHPFFDFCLFVYIPVVAMSEFLKSSVKKVETAHQSFQQLAWQWACSSVAFTMQQAAAESLGLPEHSALLAKFRLELIRSIQRPAFMPPPPLAPEGTVQRISDDEAGVVSNGSSCTLASCLLC
jgi:hypothetical protein